MKNYKASNEVDEQICIICLEEYEDNDDLLLFPCGHYFHYDCLVQYNNIKRTINYVDSPRNPRCTLCQLNLIRHYLYYKEHGLNLRNSIFDNKE